MVVKLLSHVQPFNYPLCNLPGSSVHGIFQARILEWVAISFSRGSSQHRNRTQTSCIADRFFNLQCCLGSPEYIYKCYKIVVKSLSCVRLFATQWTVAYQAPPSMGFSRQEYWSGLPFPFPGALPNPGIEPRSPALQTETLPSEPPGKSESRL